MLVADAAVAVESWLRLVSCVSGLGAAEAAVVREVSFGLTSRSMGSGAGVGDCRWAWWPCSLVCKLLVWCPGWRCHPILSQTGGGLAMGAV